MAVLFVFVDGLGLASPASPPNPVSELTEPPLALVGGQGAACEGFRLLEADATLGVEGVPQSATGGASLFTGENAPELLGEHRQGLPNTPLRELIARASLLRQARERGALVGFANAYTPKFFERGRTRRRSVSTVMAESSGLRLNRLDDLIRGRAIYRDFTHTVLNEQGIGIEPLSPEVAGARLGRMAAKTDLMVYEYFQTDTVGHRGSFEEAVGVLSVLNRFLAAAIEQLDPENDGFVLSSDHGNVENMEVSSHTTNPVPILLWGRAAERWPDSGCGWTICDVAPGILSLLPPF